MRLLAVLGVAAALVTGCSTDLDTGGDTTGGGSGSGVVTVTDSGAVEVAAGGTLRVVLEANPTTGYGWEVVIAPDEAVLAQQGEAVYGPTVTDTALVGSGGATTFEFLAVGAGSTTVELVYRRPWEDGVEPVETVTIDVTVG